MTLKVTNETLNQPAFHSGMHHMAPGGIVPRHCHEDQMETIFCHQGHGKAILNDEEFPIQSGSMLCCEPKVWHSVINDSDAMLVIFWVISPPGELVNYFRSIGKACQPEDTQPPAAFKADRSDNAEPKS